jgi:hypothetical protein
LDVKEHGPIKRTAQLRDTTPQSKQAPAKRARFSEVNDSAKQWDDSVWPAPSTRVMNSPVAQATKPTYPATTQADPDVSTTPTSTPPIHNTSAAQRSLVLPATPTSRSGTATSPIILDTPTITNTAPAVLESTTPDTSPPSDLTHASCHLTDLTPVRPKQSHKPALLVQPLQSASDHTSAAANTSASLDQYHHADNSALARVENTSTGQRTRAGVRFGKVETVIIDQESTTPNYSPPPHLLANSARLLAEAKTHTTEQTESTTPTTSPPATKSTSEHWISTTPTASPTFSKSFSLMTSAALDINPMLMPTLAELEHRTTNSFSTEKHDGPTDTNLLDTIDQNTDGHNKDEVSTLINSKPIFGPFALRTDLLDGYHVMTPARPALSKKVKPTASEETSTDETTSAIDTPTLSKKKSTSSTLQLAEFDPLADPSVDPPRSTTPTDPAPETTTTPKQSPKAPTNSQTPWMMRFETPKPVHRAPSATATQVSNATKQQTGKGPVPSVLDMSFEFNTPRSVPTYSIRDVEKIRREAAEKVGIVK